MNLLRLDGVNGPVYFVLDGNEYREPGDTDEEVAEGRRFFYEEHSCPTNWINNVVAVIEGGDCDPHGFLKYIRSVRVPDDFDQHDDEHWPKLFPELFATK